MPIFQGQLWGCSEMFVPTTVYDTKDELEGLVRSWKCGVWPSDGSRSSHLSLARISRLEVGTPPLTPRCLVCLVENWHVHTCTAFAWISWMPDVLVWFWLSNLFAVHRSIILHRSNSADVCRVLVAGWDALLGPTEQWLGWQGLLQVFCLAGARFFEMS